MQIKEHTKGTPIVFAHAFRRFQNTTHGLTGFDLSWANVLEKQNDGHPQTVLFFDRLDDRHQSLVLIASLEADGTIIEGAIPDEASERLLPVWQKFRAFLVEEKYIVKGWSDAEPPFWHPDIDWQLGLSTLESEIARLDYRYRCEPPETIGNVKRFTILRRSDNHYMGFVTINLDQPFIPPLCIGYDKAVDVPAESEQVIQGIVHRLMESLQFINQGLHKTRPITRQPKPSTVSGLEGEIELDAKTASSVEAPTTITVPEDDSPERTFADILAKSQNSETAQFRFEVRSLYVNRKLKTTKIADELSILERVVNNSQVKNALAWLRNNGFIPKAAVRKRKRKRTRQNLAKD